MKLKIYFTSDVHGHIYPTDYRDTKVKNQGYLNILNSFEKTPNTIIIDGGDTIQGSPFTTYLKNQNFTQHPLARVLNEAPYDIFITGNHDYNYGEDYLVNFISDFKGTTLAANVKHKENKELIKPYKLFTLPNETKVLVVGLTTDYINIWESKENLNNFEVSDTYQTMKNLMSELPKHDILIGAYHGGFEYDLETDTKLSDSTENIGYKLCKNFPFDVLLTGHQHTPIINKSIFGTYIAQTPANGEAYVEINITIENKEIVEIEGSIQQPNKDAHPELSLQLLGWETQVQTWLDTPVGFLDVELIPKKHLEMALEGTYLANFFNQVQLEVTGADISCTSMANSMKGFGKEVTVRDVVSTYVYPNTLVVKEVSGEILRKALERSASYFAMENDSIVVANEFLKPKVAHYNFDYFSNIYYEFDLTKPVGQRVVTLSFNGREVSHDDVLTLVMNNYRASGTGGYEFFRDCKTVKDLPIDVAEQIIDYLSKHKEVTIDKTQYYKVKASK